MSKPSGPVLAGRSPMDDDWPPVNQPGSGVLPEDFKVSERPAPRDVNSRDGQWIYHQSGCGWVGAVTHQPTGIRIKFSGTIATARAQARSGMLLNLIPKENTVDDPFAEVTRLAKSTPLTEAELTEAAKVVDEADINCTAEQAALMIRLYRIANGHTADSTT